MDQQLLATLLDPAFYPEPTHDVQLVQTHVSYLFITDSCVYKIKKPVDFGFLNFVDLERRRFYCQEEVRLNSRLCPGMYLGVVALSRDGATYRFDKGDGVPIEYAVKMLRLPQERMLNRLLDAGAVSADDLRAIARRIAEFHLRASTNDTIASYGRPETIRANWEENFRQLAPFIPQILGQDELQRIRHWVTSFMCEQDLLLQQRVTAGYIRDGDGDIHSENICLTDQIWIFDCIEFSDRYRCADTAADLAFLLMDLEVHGRPDLAAVALATYTAITGDEGCLALLPFYKVYRAVVRAKVEAFRSNDPECPPVDRQRAVQQARSYLRLARGLIIRQRLPPTLFLMCGLMGCGKTTLARALAFELGLPVIRSDLLRKELSGLPATERVHAGYGEHIYQNDVTRRTYATLAQRAAAYLTAGSGVIIDASFTAAEHREHFCQLATRLQVPCYILHLVGDDALHLQRLLWRAAEGIDASDGRSALYHQQKNRFSAPAAADFVLSLDAGSSPDDLVASVYHALHLDQ
jgi:aminoglycoside phosphotransferase family enzyme/predicted kinase